MSLHRRNPKRDGNEKPIVDALERAGCLVARLSGAGLPDLLVARQGRLYALEVKQRKAKLTDAQEAFRGAGWPVMVARTPEQALCAVGVLASL